MPGEVGILSVGAGHIKLKFDPNDEVETTRAARIVKDMLRRGYALMVEIPSIDGTPARYRRATDFDDKACEYIIADLDSTPVQEKPTNDDQTGTEQETAEQSAASNVGAAKETTASRPKKQTKLKHTRISARTTNATAVAHSAGG